MTGKKETGATWHHTTVVLRSDIYRQALVQGIDISDACNRALSSLTGSRIPPAAAGRSPRPATRYHCQGWCPSHRLPGSIKKASYPRNCTRSSMRMILLHRPPSCRQKPGRKESPGRTRGTRSCSCTRIPEERTGTAPAARKRRRPRKGRDAPAKKRTKGDALKTFFSSKIARTDEAEAAISKDELYELFARFCRDHRITPVPERKAVTVALKNQFALTEKMVDGTPCWTGIRLK